MKENDYGKYYTIFNYNGNYCTDNIFYICVIYKYDLYNCKYIIEEGFSNIRLRINKNNLFSEKAALNVK